eukprot:4120632-Karenia_brevis.AAC.1
MCPSNNTKFFPLPSPWEDFNFASHIMKVGNDRYAIHDDAQARSFLCNWVLRPLDPEETC